MNKKIKIISTIALTGMMGLNVLGSSSYAVNVVSNGKTQVFDASTIGGKKIVPVVLDGKTDTVTRTEIKAKYPEATSFSGESQDKVGTGETFKIGKDTYTVMVYGDVNGDGSVNSADALLVERYRTKDTTLKLEADQLMAADVASRDGAINSADSLRIKEYAVNMKRTPVDSVPEADKKPEVPETKYDYDVVVNENNIINGQRKAKVKVTPKIELEKGTNLTLTIKVLDKDGNEVKSGNTSIADGVTVTLTEQDKYAEASADITLPAVDDFADQDLTFQIFNGTEKIGEVKNVEMHSASPVVGNVVTDRSGTESAKMVSLDVLNNGTLKTVKYVVKPIVKNDAGVVTDDGKVAEADRANLTETLEATNNKITNKPLTNASGYNKASAYTVSYILVDAYGNESEAIRYAIIASGEAEASEATVSSITAPTLVDNNNKAFTWELAGDLDASQELYYTLYKDNVPVKTGKLTSGDFTSDMGEAGEYKLGIVIKSLDGTIKDTTEKTSGIAKVSKLNKASNVKFEVKSENNVNNYVLSWDADNASFADYDVELYSYTVADKDFTTDESTKLVENEEAKVKSIKIDNDSTDGMSTDTLYKAKVTVKAEANQYKYIDSDVETSEMFFIINASGLLKPNPVVNETSITYELKDINVEGLDEEVKYQVKVYKKINDPNDDEIKSTQYIDTRDVAISTDEAGQKYLTISNLDKNTDYSFRLIAKIGKAEGVATSAIPAKTTIKTPEIKGLTVVKNPTTAEKGKIGVNGTTLYINGETIENYATANYTDEFVSNITNIVAKLKKDDVVTIVDNKITLDLKSGVENDTVALTAGTENKVLEITGNTFNKTVTVSEKLQELIVNAGLFDISGVSAEKYTLAQDAKVTADKEFTIKANSVVRVNGVEIEAKKEANIAVAGTAITVKTTTNTQNDLAFKNESGKDVTIAFVPVGSAGIYTGTVTISSNGGSVEISQTSVELDKVDLTIDVKSGDIDVSGFNGENLNTTVNVKNDETTPTTLKVKSEVVAPIAFTNVPIKNYSVEENHVENIPGIDMDDEEEVKKVIDFMNSFGFQGTGATLTADADSNEVTITFPEEANVSGEVTGLATK